jgi:hypothetical protein
MGFCRYYNSLNLEFRESVATHSHRILSYFDMLGRMLGYSIVTENKMKSFAELTDFSFPPELRNTKIDMLWCDWNEFNPFVLALESQQSPEPDQTMKDMRKLLAIPANLRVLYCSSENSDTLVEEIRNGIEKAPKDMKRPFLAIIDPWVSRDKFAEGSLKGIYFNENGATRGVGIAKVGQRTDGLNRIRVLSEARWTDAN